jgi:hypothetical protein
MSSFFLVLHPRHKLAYFEAAGWDQAWIDTAKDLVRKQFELQYTALPTTVSMGDRHGSDVGDKQGDSLKSKVNHTIVFVARFLSYC